MFLKKITSLGSELGKAFGYVYLFDYYYRKRNGQTVHLIKIGSSKNPKERFKSVQADLPEKLHVRSVWTVWYPEHLERNILHRKFWDKKDRPPGAGPRAGADEFFKLNSAEKLKVTVILATQSVKFAAFWVSLFFAPFLLYLCLFPETHQWIAKLVIAIREFLVT